CETCHSELETYARYEVASVKFPSGASLDTGNPDSNMCLMCHQGRASGKSIAEDIEGLEPDAVSEDLGFVNVHYYAASATLFGSEALGGYQFEGREYAAKNEHVMGFATCTECHDAHLLQLNQARCYGCHPVVEDGEMTDIRMSVEDLDGDGDSDEGVAGEISTYVDLLYQAMQEYAALTIGTGIIYDSHAYPYFFTDLDDDGEIDADEANYANQYATWSPNLLAAAYNYQFAVKDPGAYAHNPNYVIQLLYDSLEAVGADVTGLTRP
ncbi:MAG: polyheme membrane-associated cytochrome C, partial [Chloroflexota bacterium]